MPEPRVFVGVGSNIDPERNIVAAGLLLGERCGLVACSTFYRTAAVERPDQRDFLNGVFEIQCELDARRLKFDVLRRIETELGRARVEDAYAARPIDLDVLLHGRDTLREADISIPDETIRTRAFVAVPLLELAPDLILPDTGGRLDGLEITREADALDADIAFTKRLKARLGL